MFFIYLQYFLFQVKFGYFLSFLQYIFIIFLFKFKLENYNKILEFINLTILILKINKYL
jgi:hypothetical protein